MSSPSPSLAAPSRWFVTSSRSRGPGLSAALLLTAVTALGCKGKSKEAPPEASSGGEAGTKAETEGDAEATAKAEAEAAAVAAAWADWPAGPAPKGLSRPPAVPEDNPLTAEKIALGHRLFMDKRLSVDGSRSCYSCHQNHLGNADGRPRAKGPGDVDLPRNTPTIWNVAYHGALYWDGRAPSLEKQALGAWGGGNMGVPADALPDKTAEFAALDDYQDAFEAAFDLDEGATVTPEHVAMALSSYERTLLCGDTAHDRGERSEAADRGWDLFRGKAQCVSCHNGDNFTDGLYHAAGIGFDAEGEAIGTPDVGRAKPAGDEAELYKFRTPTLRNVARTAPYFHDGSVATLEEAVRYMATGGNAAAPNKDPLMRNVGLTDAEISDIVAFLGSLDCPGTLEEIGDQSVPGVIAPPA